MNQQLLIDTLSLDERLAPDPDEVRAGVAGGIRRRRRRRIAGYGVSVLVLVLVAAVVPIARHTERTASAPITTGTWQRTIHFGYLPDGLATPLYAVSATGEGVLYPLFQGDYLRVDVTSVDWRPRLDRPGWQATTVNGRPARMVSRPKRTIIDWQLPSGRWANLEYGRGAEGAQAALTVAAERIAAGITEGVPQPVRMAFELTYLPRGTRIMGVRGVSPKGYGTIDVTSGSLDVIRVDEGTTEDGVTVDHPVLDDAGRFGVSFHPGTWRPDLGDARTGDIQGKPAWTTSYGLAVDWSPHGTVHVSRSEEARKVAEGVRWTG